MNDRNHTIGESWSDKLKIQTRDLIDSRGPVGTPDGSLPLKHIVSGFGTVTEDDLVNGVFRIVDRKTKSEIDTFATIDDLIAAGWAID